MKHFKQTIHAEAGLHRKLVLFAVALEGYLAHFPNCHKHSLTQAIRVAFVDVYNLVTEAQKRYQKKTTLTQLDIRHEQLRMLINLAHELGLFDFSAGRKDTSAPGDRRHLVILRLVDELGRMIGGWVNQEVHGQMAVGADIQGREPANAAGA
jgi:hypothetical protein